MRVRFALCFIFLFAISFASRNACAQENHQHSLTEAEFGSVKFLTSCSPAVENNFNRAVAMLHSFQYELATQAFGDIAKQGSHLVPLRCQVHDTSSGMG